jgi:putative nucleotidyltransferase with HDIG domain
MNEYSFLIIIPVCVLIGYYLKSITRGVKVIKAKAVTKAPTVTKPAGPPAQTESLVERRLVAEESISIIEKLSENISTSLNLSELAENIIQTVCKMFNVEICALLFLDEATDTLDLIANTGIDSKIANEIHIRNGEEISGMVAKYNTIKLIDNFEKETPLWNLKYDSFYKKSLVSIPISFKDNVLGVLNISNKKSGEPFSPRDVEIIKIIAIESAIALQNFKLLQELSKNYLNTIIALASAIDARDPYTYHHSSNVTKYSVRLAQEMKLSKKTIENIRYSGLLHDIGKIGIRDDILLKPERLTDEEYTQIKKHSLKGEEIIKSLPFLGEVSPLVRHHHERFDGRGYPDGIKGEDIEIGARIMALADSFDAMTTKRTYREPLSLDKVKEELIKNKNTQFDPSLVDCFLKILEKEPTLLTS